MYNWHFFFHLLLNSRARFSIPNCSKMPLEEPSAWFQIVALRILISFCNGWSNFQSLQSQAKIFFAFALDGHNLYFTHWKSLHPNCSNIRLGKIFLYRHISYIGNTTSWRRFLVLKQAFKAESDCGRMTNSREFFSIFPCFHERVTGTEKT
jgi:hypothetical protein